MGWALFFTQLAACVVIIILSYYLVQPKGFAEGGREALDAALAETREGPSGHSFVRRGGHVRNEPSIWTSMWAKHAGNYHKRVEFTTHLHSVPQALSHRRTFKNFARSNVDESWLLPPAKGEVRWSASLERTTLYPYLIVSDGDGLKPVLMRALALGFFSGAGATYFYLLIRWETYRLDPIAFAQNNPASHGGSYSMLVSETGKKISALVTAFKFFPSFLALGYVGYAIQRWRSFQSACYSIQGALCNVALMVGGSLTSPHDEASKQLAFRVYRYLQVIPSPTR